MALNNEDERKKSGVWPSPTSEAVGTRGGHGGGRGASSPNNGRLGMGGGREGKGEFLPGTRS